MIVRDIAWAQVATDHRVLRRHGTFSTQPLTFRNVGNAIAVFFRQPTIKTARELKLALMHR